MIYEKLYEAMKSMLLSFSSEFKNKYELALDTEAFVLEFLDRKGFLINRLPIDDVLENYIDGGQKKQFGFNLRSAQVLNNPNETDKIKLSEMLNELFEYMKKEISKYEILPKSCQGLELENINTSVFLNKDEGENYYFSIDLKINYYKE